MANSHSIVLREIEWPAGRASITVTFKYDPFGRRIEKSSTATTSVFAYDGQNLVEETNSSGAVAARYEQGTGVDEPLSMLRTSSTSYYQQDGLGSVTSLTNSSGAAAETYTYDSFGKQTAASGSITNPFQYTGRESDLETGLYYYRARYYDPSTGRFDGEDPLGFGGGDVNLYDYAGNSPVGYRDTLGLWRWPDFVLVNINVTIPTPWTGTLVGWSGTASVDRYGHWYWSPIGGGIGQSLTGVSGSVTANWMNQHCKPTAAQLHDMLTAHGFNFTAGYGGGVSESWTPGTGTATGIGFVSPQIGGSYNYSFQGPGNAGSGW